MASGADVRSIQAMRDWLADLATYRSDVSESLAGVAMEIRRGLDWLEEQLQFWQRAVRQCEDDVHQAKMELAQRKTPDWSGREPDTTLQVKALRRAQARLEHAQDQVQKCKTWLVRLPKAIDETYSGPAARLQAFLDGELPNGMTGLSRQIDALDKYTGAQRDFSAIPPSARSTRESSS